MTEGAVTSNIELLPPALLWLGFSNDDVVGAPVMRSWLPASVASSVVIELKLPDASRWRGRGFLSSLPCPNNTRPLRVVLPDRVRKDVGSFASFDVGRTGEGDVARKSIKSAASVSLGGTGVPIRLKLGCPCGVVLSFNRRLL